MNFLQRLFNYPTNTLDEEIAMIFANHYPVTAERVLYIKNLLGSWADIEGLLEFTLAYGYSDPYHCIGLFFDTPDGQSFRKMYNQAYNRSLRSE